MSIFEKYPRNLFLEGLKTSHPIFDLPRRIEDLFVALDGKEDPHFGTELDKDPQSRIWEMMVATLLAENGVLFTTMSDGPDFCALTPNGRIWIDAICPTTGKDNHPDSVPHIESTEGMQPVPEEKLILRVTSALSEKKRKFRDYLTGGVVSYSDSIIVAVSSMKLTRRVMPPCLGLRATVGLSNPVLRFDRTTDEVEQGYSNRTQIIKTNLRAIPVTGFLTGDFPEISALLYSDASPFSCEFNLHADSLLILNPLATNPLPAAWLTRTPVATTLINSKNGGDPVTTIVGG